MVDGAIFGLLLMPVAAGLGIRQDVLLAFVLALFMCASYRLRIYVQGHDVPSEDQEGGFAAEPPS